MQCVSLVKLMPLSAFAMTRKNTIKNAFFSRRKFRTTTLALPRHMNGFIKRDATLIDQDEWIKKTDLAAG